MGKVLWWPRVACKRAADVREDRRRGEGCRPSCGISKQLGQALALMMMIWYYL